MKKSQRLPEPRLLGAPDHFPSWRPEQEDAIWAVTGSDKRFNALGMPTGSGKSLASVVAGQLLGARTLVLTSTKGLQEQYSRDFTTVGMEDIRGMNNYRCAELEPWGAYNYLNPASAPATADRGPCKWGMDCPRKSAGCDYYDQLRLAKTAPLVVTNYAYWLAMGRNQQRNTEYGEPLGEFDTIVLDEAHDAADALCSALAIEIEKEAVLVGLGMSVPEHDAPLDRWIEWGKEAAATGDELLKELKKELLRSGPSAELMKRTRLVTEVTRRAAMLQWLSGEWVVGTPAPQSGVAGIIEPVWGSPYAEQLLFRGIKRVLLVSATLCRKTAHLLGIKDDELEFREYDSSFPLERRRVIRIPTVRMHWKMTDGERRIWADRILRIIDSRTDRKGLVHTVSYDRAQYLARHIEDDTEVPLFTHTSRTTRAVIEQFKRHRGGAVMISPSLGTGYDFPDDLLRYQIIAKVPWPDTRDPITAARVKGDKEYAPYSVMQQMVQMAGRSTRSATDWSETFVVDDFFATMMRQYGKFAPKSFRAAVKVVKTIPPAPNWT